MEFAPENGNLLATGSRENTIHLWDLRVPHSDSSEAKPERKICGAHAYTSSATSESKKSGTKKKLASSVTAIQFQDENTLISCSDTDGLIKIKIIRCWSRF